MNFSIVITNLAVIFIMIAVGLFTGRGGILSEKAQKDFTAFLMQITVPCTIFSSMIREFDRRMAFDSLLILIIGFTFFGLGSVLWYKVSGLLKVEKERRGIWAVASAFSNIGFMGFPLTLAIFGNDGLFLAAVMNFSFNFTAWTIGPKLIGGGSGDTDLKHLLLTNINIGTALGMVFFLAGIPVPDVPMRIISAFGDITTPLSMFLIGLSLSGNRISHVFTDKDIRSITVVRLVIVPLLSMLILKALPLEEHELLVGVVTLIMAMPGPSVALMLAQRYEKDAELAAGAIFMTSLCCIITIPLILMLL
ncbi:MAG: AEC family transporter [Lachnospiraceae bacterium]|nr:AEC family transporter [Lachnospiraceae bacterium]